MSIQIPIRIRILMLTLTLTQMLMSYQTATRMQILELLQLAMSRGAQAPLSGMARLVWAASYQDIGTLQINNVWTAQVTRSMMWVSSHVSPVRMAKYIALPLLSANENSSCLISSNLICYCLFCLFFSKYSFSWV